MANHYGKSAVKASLIHFLFGKALNAVVSLATLIVLARWLAPGDYGIYIAFIALQATMLAVSNLGIDTTAERFMPELRMRHSDTDLLGFVGAVLAARTASLLLLLAVGWIFAENITGLVGLGEHKELFRLWLLVVGLAGLLAFAVVLLEAMLHQRQAQNSMSAYVVLKLILLIAVWRMAEINIKFVVLVELLATAAAAAISLIFLLSHFSRTGLRTGWLIVKANRKRLQRFAFFNYLAQVIFQLFNAEAMKLLVTRLLGILQSAVYGFAYSLADTVQRYLPAVLLLRLIKPVFVSRYVKTGDFEELNAMARLILKLNLLVLTPAIALAAVYGGDLLSLMSGGKYADGHWLFVGILGLLVLTSHQLVLSLIAGTLEKNTMQLYAGLASTIAFPCALWLIPKWGPLGAVAASAAGGFTYNIFATNYLRRLGYAYAPEARAAYAFLISGLLTYASCLLLKKMLIGLSPLMLLAICLGASSLIYTALVRVLSAFSNKERELLNTILPRKVFIF
ncbi:RfbX Membrane protein involved in the export of O-antigen and teichoic acid [Comamonadaceae bacterium]